LSSEYSLISRNVDIGVFARPDTTNKHSSQITNPSSRNPRRNTSARPDRGK
jgi:hypothetical protein